MTDPQHTAICLLVDRSGSMQSIKGDAEGGINAFLDAQRTAPGRRTVRIDTFDDQFDNTTPATPATDVPRFHLHPRGMTALLDAMARSMTEFGAELAAMPETARPGQVIFAVMTDGQENASREHDWPTVAAMVTTQETQFGWQVLYLGANQDAVRVGARFGVRHDRSMTFSATDHGTRSVTSSLRSYVATAATGQQARFTDEQRDDAVRDQP